MQVFDLKPGVRFRFARVEGCCAADPLDGVLEAVEFVGGAHIRTWNLKFPDGHVEPVAIAAWGPALIVVEK